VRGARRVITAVVMVMLAACSSGPAQPGHPTLYSAADLVSIGFGHSRVVMLNDIHNGALRLVRSREVAQSVLGAASKEGVAFLAMEALTIPFADQASPDSYLAQPEMRSLIAAALSQGMTLVPYEVDQASELPASLRSKTPSDPAWIDWRERTQAAHLAGFLGSRPAAKVLVYAGDAHINKTPSPGFTPMAVYFERLTKINPFSIDQSVTSELNHDRPTAAIDSSTLAALATMPNRSGGYLRTGDPNSARRSRDYADAFILSLDNHLQ
jgi:hypothetical protein